MKLEELKEENNTVGKWGTKGLKVEKIFDIYSCYYVLSSLPKVL